MPEFGNQFETKPKPGKPKKTTEKGVPTIQNPVEPRDESVGEANVKIASWFIAVAAFFRVQFHDYEKEALEKAMGAFVRRWPSLRKFNTEEKK